MKKILFLLFALALLTSCEKDPVVDKGKLDPNAMILIKPAKGVQMKATVPGLTAIEVVEQALNIKWQTHYGAMGYTDEVVDIGRSFNEHQKDYETPALLMLGVDVIAFDHDGQDYIPYYTKVFTHAFNVVITDNNNDTIAYVPDAVINAARPLIEAAYEEEDYTEVYRLFNEAFTFLPISE